MTIDAAATIAWLREPRPSSAPRRFVEINGPVLYSRWMQPGSNHRRAQWLASAECEVATCDRRDDTGSLVFDHCHRHGWIRAVLCNRHNQRLGHVEAAWLEDGLDPSGTPYAVVLSNCPGCSGTLYIPPQREYGRYRGIVDDIREKIHAGQLKPGDQLPSITQLRAQYDCGTTAIRNAMLVLRSEGLIEGHQGRGVFVATPPE